MFEKETEEHCNKAICSLCEITCHAKCHEWQDEYDAFQQGAVFGYNKANEWHDLRKDSNDLPKDNDEKLCFYGKGKVVARYDREYGCWETYFNNLETVIPSSVIIAWKECPVLPPKESE